MNRRSTFLLTTFLSGAFFLAAGLLHAQPAQFSKYTNPDHKFSFDIPTTWAIHYSAAQQGIICAPITPSEKAIYRDCYEGIVFRMQVTRAGLDSTLVSSQLYSRVGDSWYTTDRLSDSVKATNLKGPGWTGIYHNNVCGISCKSSGFHANDGQCEFIYFSDGRITVCIDTNGGEFDAKILKRLRDSFRFSE